MTPLGSKTVAVRLLVLVSVIVLLCSAVANAMLRHRGGGGSVTAPAQTIASISLSNNTFTAATANAVVGTVTVTMNPASPAFGGTLNVTGANSGGFHLSGTTSGSSLEAAAGGTVAGTYTDFNIVATQAGISNSPQSISPSITGTNPPTLVSITFATDPVAIQDTAAGGQVVTTFTVNMSDSSTYPGTPTGACQTQSPCPFMIGGSTGNWNYQVIPGGLNSSYDASSLHYVVTAN